MFYAEKEGKRMCFPCCNLSEILGPRRSACKYGFEYEFEYECDCEYEFEYEFEYECDCEYEFEYEFEYECDSSFMIFYCKAITGALFNCGL